MSDLISKQYINVMQKVGSQVSIHKEKTNEEMETL